MIIILSAQSYAQTFSPEYIESLPPDVQADVLQNIASTPEVDPRIYRGPQTDVRKIDSVLAQIKLQLDEIELEVENSKGIEDKKLKKFGYDFFKTFQTTFMPVNLPNLSDDYILGFGDELTINYIGNNQKASLHMLERDGSIIVEGAGKIYLSGLKLGDATDLVKKRFQDTFIGVEPVVTLTSLRDINILVMGFVKFPGMYTVSGYSNPLSALNSAGGINESGSLRHIEHKRDGKTLMTYDLYDIFINGEMSFKHQMRSGDVILVSASTNTVGISGGVSRPAIYEFKDGNTLKDIFSMSGGLVANADVANISIKRNFRNESGTYSLDLNNSDDFILLPGDGIEVSYYENIHEGVHSITLSGEIKNPGKYTIKKGEKLSDVIKKAGGYTDQAYPLGGKLFRASTKEIETQINEKLYKEMIAFLVSSPQSSQVGVASSLPLILSEFKNIEALGRVTAEFNLAVLERENQLDIPLLDQDEIIIPQYKPEVYVFGEVLNPGSRLFSPSMNGNDYLKLSGGLARFAERDKIIIIHPNGDTFLLSASMNFFTSQRLEILPGTIIYVPREIGKLDGINYAATIAPIFSSLALSLASLNSIN